ncbi:DNA helicase, TrwC and TraI like protein [Leptolyngbya sp. NIES-3755]|nr:DNA helicase, TrwC and TraI like protein [Leptolyngbya sp. NIES-3755]
MLDGEKQCGYEIEVRSNGQFELRGYGQKLLDVYSNRTQEIQAHLEKWEQAQGEAATPAQRKAATLKTRKNKVRDVDREMLFQQWGAELKVRQLQLPDIPKNQAALIDREWNATQSVNAGVNHCSERDSLFRRSQVERFALEHHLGEQSFDALQSAFDYNPALIQGAERVMELLRQPEVRSQYEQIVQAVNCLQRWQQATEYLGHRATKLNEIHQVTQIYLDEHKSPQVFRQQIQEDLTRYQNILNSQKQLEI